MRLNSGWGCQNHPKATTAISKPGRGAKGTSGQMVVPLLLLAHKWVELLVACMTFDKDLGDTPNPDAGVAHDRRRTAMESTTLIILRLLMVAL